MLLDTIQRLQAKQISLVSIDSLRAYKQFIPPQIHSVPALMILPSKQILFGKQVFDYLLLPGKGVLISGVAKPTNMAGASSQQQQQQQQQQPLDPQAFSLHISNGLGDNFSFIEDETIPNQTANTNTHRNYTWTSIDDDINLPIQSSEVSTVQTSTRVKKETLDLEEFKARRAEDLQVVINTNITEPPVTTY